MNFALIGPPPQDMAAVQFSDDQWVTFGLPKILRGDECHYLMMAHSLGGDLDLNLDDEYKSVLDGGPQMGAYFSRMLMILPAIHYTMHRDGYLINKHPPGLSVFLALFLWPLADSWWMEPAALWISAATAAFGVAFFIRCLLALNFTWTVARNTGLLLAFASPWFAYSQSLLTEIYIGTTLIIVLDGVLRGQVWRTIPLAFLVGWIKYPGLLAFFAAGCAEAAFRRPKNFFLIGIAGAVCLAGILTFNRVQFRGEEENFPMPVHQNLRDPRLMGSPPSPAVVEAAKHLPIPIYFVPGNPVRNIYEGLFDRKRGLLQFTPILFFAAWGLYRFYRRDVRRFAGYLFFLLPYAVIHFLYEFLLTGSYYSLRYLVPSIPMLMIALPYFTERAGPMARRFFWAAVAWSLLMNVLAALFPAIAFKTGPRQILKSTYEIVAALLGFGPS